MKEKYTYLTTGRIEGRENFPYRFESSKQLSFKDIETKCHKVFNEDDNPSDEPRDIILDSVWEVYTNENNILCFIYAINYKNKRVWEQITWAK